MKHYTFFLSGSEQTTGSTYTVTGEKGGSVIENNGVDVTGEIANDAATSQPAGPDTSSDVQSNTNAETSVPSNDVQSQSSGFFGGGTMTIILIYALFIGAFYYFVLRPQKKRQQEAQAVIDSLEVGDAILTSSGYYGTITDIGADTCVVEFGTNKGVRIPVRKSEILRKETPNI